MHDQVIRITALHADHGEIDEHDAPATQGEALAQGVGEGSLGQVRTPRREPSKRSHPPL